MAASSLVPDRFTLLLVGTVTLASLFQADGRLGEALAAASSAAVCLLFFLHGAKLSREAIWSGVTNWRLHLLVAVLNFVAFPALGLALRPVLEPLVTPDLYLGVLFLCALPGTVQSAIAMVSMARGNVPAALCSASASSLLGIAVTPLLVGLLITHGAGGNAPSGNPWHAAGTIAAQLLLPFIAGQLLRPWIGGWIKRHGALTKVADQGSILLVVYVAFSHAVKAGLWHQVPPSALAGLFVVCAVLLGGVLVISTWSARLLGFGAEDEITIVFCGSKKSLVNGVPMAKILFAASVAGVAVLPLMLFHQMQLMVCAALARRYARRGDRDRLAAPASASSPALRPARD